MFSIVDIAELSGMRKTSDGYLVGDMRIARTGIQTYGRSELGLSGAGSVKVWRPEASVFDKASMASMAYKPLTNDHPAETVDASNWRDLAVGQTGGDVARDGDYVRVPMVLMDAAAIAAVESGKRELSVGYMADIDFTPGVTPGGDAYDAIQTNIRGNHVAIVDSGRAGSKARIGDAGKWGNSPEKKEDVDMADAIKTRTVLVDGLSVETTDAGAQALDKLQSKIEAGKQALADAKAAAATDVAKKDAEIATKDAEIDALKAKVLDDAAIDAKVRARADLITKATSIVADLKTDGLSADEIRKATVKSKLGDTIEGKAQAYIDARFDILAEDAAGTDPVSKLKIGNNTTTIDKMYADRDAALGNAWDAKETA